MTQPAPAEPQPTVPTCYRHPKRETYVRCTRCERPICPDCMIEASVGFQCPECVADGRRTQRQVRSPFGGTRAGMAGYVTKGLIAVNLVMLLFSVISAKSAKSLAGGGLGGVFGGSTPLTEWGSVWGLKVMVYQGTEIVASTEPAGVAVGEFYRLFTAMFLHYGLIHLAVNMWALWIVGRQLESVLGPLRFLGLYLLCGLGGNVAAYVFAPDGQAAGASTAIFGLFAAYFVVVRRLGGNASAIIPTIAINVFITFAVPGISIAGHLGGLVTGALVAAGLVYAPQKHRTLLQIASMVGTFALLIGFTLAQTIALNT
jgi:membrane associated rhomboid family serine protease